MKENLKYHNYYSYKTDRGRVRLTNQDQVTVISNKVGDQLLVIADGLGGHNKGDYASKLAVDFISDAFCANKGFISVFVAKYWLQHIINSANRAIYHFGEKNPPYKGMGTTLVMVLIRKNNLICFNVGDSRAYIYQNNTLKLLSEDQSYVGYLTRSGQINKEEAEKREDKNVLLSALGVFPSTSTNVSIHPYKYEPIILCSDGLTNNVSEDDMVKIIKDANLDAEDKVNALVDKANANGGSDNISVIYFMRNPA